MIGWGKRERIASSISVGRRSAELLGAGGVEPVRVQPGAVRVAAEGCAACLFRWRS